MTAKDEQWKLIYYSNSIQNYDKSHRNKVTFSILGTFIYDWLLTTDLIEEKTESQIGSNFKFMS